MKRLFSRLQTIKWLGKRSPIAYIYSLTGNAAQQQVWEKSGTINGCAMVSGGNSSSNVGAVIINPNVTFDGGRNGIDVWSGDIANAYTISNPFGNNVPGIGLKYDFATVDGTEATLYSSWLLNVNEGFYLKFYPYANENSTPLHVAYRFGNWSLIFYKEKAVLARINENWTLDQEKTAFDTQDTTLIGPRVFGVAGQPDQNEDAIFDIYQELDTGNQTKSVMGDYYEVWILPEKDAGIHVAIGPRGFAKTDGQTFTALLPGETGDIYAATPLTAYTRYNALFFQVGSLTFADANLIIGPFSTPYNTGDWSDSFLSSNIAYNIRKNTPPGTSVNAEYQIINAEFFQFVLQLTTADSAYTPFVYWAQAALLGGAYDGAAEQVYDSNTDATDGIPPIMDITPSCDGDMRRQEYEIQIYKPVNMENQLFAYDGNPLSLMLENKIANLSIGDTLAGVTPVITNGLITKCTASDVGESEHTLELDGFKTYSQLHVTLSDAWSILDDDIVFNEIAGDGYYLGDYINIVLTNGGFSAEQISIASGTGRILPQAQYGDAPCVVPRQDQTRGDYLRELMSLYGFDYQLYIDGAGIWRLRQLSTALAQIEGYDAVFATTASTNNPNTYPGRLTILAPLDWVRDNSGFYNWFRVEGATVRGVTLCQEYVDYNSVQGTPNVDHAFNFIGRLKPYPTVRNDGLRTQDDVAMALRSLVTRYGISGRMFQFETYYHRGLYVYDRIKVNDTLCQITKIDGGSLVNDRMTIVAQQLS